MTALKEFDMDKIDAICPLPLPKIPSDHSGNNRFFEPDPDVIFDRTFGVISTQRNFFSQCVDVSGPFYSRWRVYNGNAT
jgi:hypothetical protein